MRTQWLRQAWGTGAGAPWSLRMHANFEDVEVSKVYFC